MIELGNVSVRLGERLVLDRVGLTSAQAAAILLVPDTATAEMLIAPRPRKSTQPDNTDPTTFAWITMD